MKNQLKTLFTAAFFAVMAMVLASCDGPVQEKLEESLGGRIYNYI